MIDKAELTKVVEEYIEEWNKERGSEEMFLVDITVSAQNDIVVSIDSDEAIDIDTCVALTRHIEARFDREVEDYELEVGSAGLSAPFKVLRQYMKYEGEEIELLTNGGEKMTGRLEDVSEEGFAVVTTQKVKPEGAKKKIDVEVRKEYRYDDVKLARYYFKV